MLINGRHQQETNHNMTTYCLLTDDNNDKPNHNTITYCGHIKLDGKNHSYNYQFYVMSYWSLFFHVSQSELSLSLDSHQTKHLHIIYVRFESICFIDSD